MTRGRRHLAGDLSRLLRESLGVLHGAVALVTVTGPGEIDVCPCCGEETLLRLRSPDAAHAFNVSLSPRWRRLSTRIRADMAREGLRPPRVVAWVRQRQERGVDHLHLVMLCRTPDEAERIVVWIRHYRRLHVRYGLGFVDDPFEPRKGGRNAVFEQAGIAGHYIGGYLTGGQLERLVAAADLGRSRLWWVSPVLLARSGWSLARCRMVRQGWAIANGSWSRRTWYGGVWLPSWWHDADQRDWVSAVVGGLPALAHGARPGPSGG